MKKHFMFMAAVLFGMLIAFGSCKNNSKSSDDDEETDEKTEKVDKKKKKHKKNKKDEDDDEDVKEAKTKLTDIRTADDLDDLDLDDVDLDDADLDNVNFDQLDIDNMTRAQANKMLKLMTMVAKQKLPEEMGDGFTMTAMAIEGSDLSFHLKVTSKALGGISMSDFNEALQMPEMKQMMIGSMMKEMDDDMTSFIKITKASGKNFSLKFVDADTGEMATLRLTNAELNELL